MTVPAVDAVITRVVLVAERHWLFERNVFPCWIGNARAPRKNSGHANHNCRDEPDAKQKSEAFRKKLRHASRDFSFEL